MSTPATTSSAGSTSTPRLVCIPISKKGADTKTTGATAAPKPTGKKRGVLMSFYCKESVFLGERCQFFC